MQRHVLLTAAEMRDAEAGVLAGGVTGFDLMARAGEAVAATARHLVPSGARILVACGPGNNGGDGYIVARSLANAGYRVEVAALEPSGEGSDASRAAAAWTGPVGGAAASRPAEFDLIVDALFGIGLSRDLGGVAAEMVERINHSGVPVLAIDIASGIDSDTGQVRGAAIRAATTVTFAARKPGHLLYPGRTHRGRIEVVDIGVPVEGIAFPGAAIFANAPSLWLDHLRRPAMDGHKYDRGHALVLSGPPGHTGAARLAARGALRSGAGLVSVVTSARALGVNAAHLTAIMLQVCDDADELSDLLGDERYNTLALGPALGIGEATRKWVATALEADRGTVLDADALTSFAGDADALAALIAPDRENPVVLTPHAGEFTRLFAGDDQTLAAIRNNASKVERARAAARFTGAVVVLKGADTVIAAPDGRAAINENGSPYRATAGSGDVLVGIIAGLLAQQVPGFEAACAAVWMHADAGKRFGPGLIAEDLPDMLPAVLRELLDEGHLD